MKPDKFDESIRRKLEGIQPSFQEDDWSKFAAYKATHTSQPFFQRFSGRTAWYTAASVAATMMVFANVYQYKKNKQLDREVVELKANIAQQKDAPVRVTTRVDTVYITKYIEVKSSNADTYESTLPSFDDESPNESTNQGQAIAESLKNVGKIIRQNPDERISEAFERPVQGNDANNEEVEAISTRDTDKNLPSKTSFRSRETAATGKSVPKNSRNLRENENNATFSTTKGNGSLNRNQRVANQLVPRSTESTKGGASQKSMGSYRSETGSYESSITPRNLPEGTVSEGNVGEQAAEEIAFLEPRTELEELTGITPAEAKVERYAYTKLSQPTSTTTATSASKSTSSAALPPPSISFKNMKFRMGIGTNLGDKSTSYSAHTSLLLGKFWSLNVGVARTFITGPQYYSEDLFKAKTQRDFKEWNKKDQPIQSPMAPLQAFNISTSANLWQLPISLTYRWPVKDGFTFLLSGGTNLNLSTCQEYSYFIRERNGEIEEKKGQFTITPAVSNDLIAAAGVEKQWKHLVVQAETYIAPYLQKPSYLTENRNIGIRFKVLYQFGKKSI